MLYIVFNHLTGIYSLSDLKVANQATLPWVLRGEQGEVNSVGDLSESSGLSVWRDETHPLVQKTVDWLRVPALPSAPRTTPACKTMQLLLESFFYNYISKNFLHANFRHTYMVNPRYNNLFDGKELQVKLKIC